MNYMSRNQKTFGSKWDVARKSNSKRH